MYFFAVFTVKHLCLCCIKMSSFGIFFCIVYMYFLKSCAVFKEFDTIFIMLSHLTMFSP